MNLVLTGFMGAGKTTVGRRLAEMLNREFFDTDEWIVAHEGKPIAEIFRDDGEDYFRMVERAACAAALEKENAVIATGGKALVDWLNRELFNEDVIVCLNASVDEILARLEGTEDRPLLLGARREVIERLVSERRAAYADIPVQIDTTKKTIEQVMQEIITAFERVQTFSPVYVKTPTGSYPTYLGGGLLDRVGAILPRENFAARGVAVTNPTVGNLYAARVVASLRACGFDPIIIEIPDGENFKTLDTLQQLYNEFVSARLERRSLVLALGGGVVGDVAGFAAATFLRGVPFVQIPTTLLAMVDASIGGKVGVDHPSGKNLIGAFKFPEAVIADADALDTLPAEELRAGMAEVIKHAIIGDEELFEQLAGVARRGDRPVAPTEFIARAMRVKINLVERDPFEQNVRAHLNLGHTFGHALEKLSHYKMRHGYAIAIGIAIAARLATRIGSCETSTRDSIIELLEKHFLPTRAPREFTTDEIIEAMGADKKIRDGKLRLILPRAIGEVGIAENVPYEEIVAALNDSR